MQTAIKMNKTEKKTMKPDYKKTTCACFIGYIVQAVVNSFVPLLFVTYQNTYQIPLTKITLLITINFVIQLLVDLLSAGFIDKIGYRVSVVLAHICVAAGLVMLTILPSFFRSISGHFVFSCDLCSGWRTFRSAGQSDH